jgi:hypothetical protein
MTRRKQSMGVEARETHTVIENITEFQEIGHSGGKVTFRVVTDLEKGRLYQISWSHTGVTNLLNNSLKGLH